MSPPAREVLSASRQSHRMRRRWLSFDRRRMPRSCMIFRAVLRRRARPLSGQPRPRRRALTFTAETPSPAPPRAASEQSYALYRRRGGLRLQQFAGVGGRKRASSTTAPVSMRHGHLRPKTNGCMPKAHPTARRPRSMYLLQHHDLSDYYTATGSSFAARRPAEATRMARDPHWPLQRQLHRLRNGFYTACAPCNDDPKKPPAVGSPRRAHHSRPQRSC